MTDHLRPRKDMAVIPKPKDMTIITEAELKKFMKAKKDRRPNISKKLLVLKQLATLTGVCGSKIKTVTRAKSAAFPKNICHVLRYSRAWSMAAVVAWLDNNDIKNMRFSEKDYAFVGKQPPTHQLDNGLVRLFLFRAKQPNFSRTGVSVVVHCEERNDYIPPHSGLMWAGSGDFGHRLVVPVKGDYY